MFNVVEQHFTEVQLHAVRRLLMRRFIPEVSPLSVRRRRRECTVVDQFTRGSATHRSACVRHHHPRTGGLTFLRIEVRSRVRVHTR